ncbi:MAG TPA: SRPBCC domain-containing protein [Afipia sp.]
MPSKMSVSANPLSVEEDELVVSRQFNAPRDLVWKAWTDPVHARHWWGPPMCPAVEMNMDVRVGGKWRNCLKSAEDGSLLWQHGVFKEVNPPRRLVFTFTWENNQYLEFPNVPMLVELTFEERDGGTLVTLRQTGFHSIADRDGHGVGWNGTFDRFEPYAAQMSAGGA